MMSFVGSAVRTVDSVPNRRKMVRTADPTKLDLMNQYLGTNFARSLNFVVYDNS